MKKESENNSENKAKTKGLQKFTESEFSHTKNFPQPLQPRKRNIDKRSSDFEKTEKNYNLFNPVK